MRAPLTTAGLTSHVLMLTGQVWVHEAGGSVPSTPTLCLILSWDPTILSSSKMPSLVLSVQTCLDYRMLLEYPWHLFLCIFPPAGPVSVLCSVGIQPSRPADGPELNEKSSWRASTGEKTLSEASPCSKILFYPSGKAGDQLGGFVSSSPFHIWWITVAKDGWLSKCPRQAHYSMMSQLFWCCFVSSDERKCYPPLLVGMQTGAAALEKTFDSFLKF